MFKKLAKLTPYRGRHVACHAGSAVAGAGVGSAGSGTAQVAH